MKIVSTLAFCTLLAPGFAFSGSLGQEHESDKEYDRTTSQQHTQDDKRAMHRDHQMDTHRQTARDKLDMTPDGFVNTMPEGSVSLQSLIGSSVKSRMDKEDIGNIEDILVDADGNLLAVIVSVGGFLGIGDKDVALSWDNVQVSYEDDDGNFIPARTTPGTEYEARPGTDPQEYTQRDQHRTHDAKPSEYVVVVNLTQDALENAPEFKRDWD